MEINRADIFKIVVTAISNELMLAEKRSNNITEETTLAGHQLGLNEMTISMMTVDLELELGEKYHIKNLAIEEKNLFGRQATVKDFVDNIIKALNI